MNKKKALVISEGGAGLPVITSIDESPRAYVDSAFLNVIHTLLLANRLNEQGYKTKIRFGVQYFTSANEYHTPEIFEENHNNIKINNLEFKQEIKEILNNCSLNDSQDLLEKYLNMFSKYLSLAPIRYFYDNKSLKSAYNYMGLLQKGYINEKYVDDEFLKKFTNQSANENTIKLILYLAELLQISKEIEIVFDTGPKIVVSKDTLKSFIPENLKQFKHFFYEEKLKHIVEFLESLDYELPSSFPFSIPDNNQIYNGIRYLFNDKNYVKKVRTYMGLNINFNIEKLTRDDLLRRIDESKFNIYTKFPLAVFEGEMIKSIDSIDILLKKENFEKWKEENFNEAKEYDKIYIIEGIEGHEANPHTIGLREKIIGYFTKNNYKRVYSPNNLKSIELKSNKYSEGIEELVKIIEDKIDIKKYIE